MKVVNSVLKSDVNLACCVMVMRMLAWMGDLKVLKADASRVVRLVAEKVVLFRRTIDSMQKFVSKGSFYINLTEIL